MEISNFQSACRLQAEISEPNTIVLTIPQNRPKSIALARVGIWITNSSTEPSSFFDSALALELREENNISQLIEVLIKEKRDSVDSRDREIVIPQKRTLIRDFGVKLFWYNDHLCFQGSISDYFQIFAPNNHSYSLTLEESKAYQMRFTYNFSKQENTTFNSGETDSQEGLEDHFISTDWVNLKLVAPVEVDSNAIEVEGIRFEPMMSEQRLDASPNQHNQEEIIHIGIKITNNTSIPLRLSSFDSLIPEMIGSEGIVHRDSGSGSLGWVCVTEANFHLVMPGECLTLLSQAQLVKQANGLVTFKVDGEGRRNHCSFPNLQTGTYWLQLVYRAPTQRGDILFDDLWMGMVHTPLIEFCIT